MLNIWTASTGTSLNSEPLNEGSIVDITLPTTGDLSGVTFKVISGTLPAGLSLVNNKIVGTLSEVPTIVTSTFVIRATNTLKEISDRTFKLTVGGEDAPAWVTPADLLPVNPNGLAYVLDSTYIDFQLQAIDTDLQSGESLEFYIQDGNGELPPGLSLSSTGKITGIIDPILALDISAGTGFFDTNVFDGYSFDFGEDPNSGRTPKKLNRNYEFVVTVTDGKYVSDRKFRIYVVGDDFLRADNNIVLIGNGTFTADNTYLRPPVWLTAANLGIKRANNYVTVFLDTFDPTPALGPVTYTLDRVNPLSTGVAFTTSSTENRTNYDRIRITNAARQPQVNEVISLKEYINSQDDNLYTVTQVRQGTVDREYVLTVSPSLGSDIPNGSVIKTGTVADVIPGLNLDTSNGELFGFIPYQPAVTREYQFTVTANKFDKNYYLKSVVNVFVYANASHGQYIIKVDPLSDEDAIRIVSQPLRIGNNYYNVSGYEGPNTTGTSYAELRLGEKLLIDVPKNTILTNTFIESAVIYGTARSSKTFTLSVIGEVESVIQWITAPDLGSVRVNLPSMLYVQAKTLVPNAVLSYKLISGELPPGLSLSASGNIIGKIRSDAVLNNNKTYTFSILAEDQYKYSGIAGTFTVKVSTPDDRLYSNIFVKPYQKVKGREPFFNFISDSGVFTPSKIYRLGDPAFGIQTELKMLIYAGIETVDIDSYMPALHFNTTRKRFTLGNVKKAVAKKYGSNIVEYEVIYVEVFDEYEFNRTSVKSQLTKLDDTKVYPCSVTNIRNNLRSIQLNDSTKIATEREFLPLWMLTPQSTETAATGYIKAIPICYCKPGEGDYVLLNIQQSGFDFTTIDYDVDRFIIDSVAGTAESQFLKFENRKFNV